jgi:hypothetical protein
VRVLPCYDFYFRMPHHRDGMDENLKLDWQPPKVKTRSQKASLCLRGCVL